MEARIKDACVWLLQGKSVSSLQASLQAMQGQAQALKDELGTDLQSQHTMEDQREVDRLSDQITQLTQQNRAAWQERIKVGVCLQPIYLPR